MRTTGEKRLSSSTCSNEMFDRFGEQGFLEPIRVLSKQECQRFLHAAHDKSNHLPLTWFKGQAVTNHAFYAIATHPKIIEVVKMLLGEDLLLFGAFIVKRLPNAVHPWHSDTETCVPRFKGVSVWMGLEHTTPESSLIIHPYSHHFGMSVQEVRHQYGRHRSETTDEEIARWGKKRDHRSYVFKPPVTDGKAVFYDSRLWHSSHNTTQKTRQALVLNYTTPDTEVWLHDAKNLDWPFTRRIHPRPPCLLVSGHDRAKKNRVVSPPPLPQRGSRPSLPTGIYPVRLSLPNDQKIGWKRHLIFQGSTYGLSNLSCHASVLMKNQYPHPPHAHQEEELLVFLSGEGDLILPDEPGLNAEHRMRIRPGYVAYFPMGFAHSLQTMSEEPAIYLVFKWNSSPTKSRTPLPFNRDSLVECWERDADKEGVRPQQLFDGPTALLRNLGCRVSTLAPAEEYSGYSDLANIAIIVLEGEIETLGKRVRPYSVVFYKSGNRHDISNPGEGNAQYVMFEFLGSQFGVRSLLYQRVRSLLNKLRDPKRWSRKLQYLGNQVKTRIISGSP